LLIAFALLVVVIVSGSIGSYYTLSYINTSNGWTTHTYKVLQTADAAMVSMVDQETGVCGYLVSGDPAFLEPYRIG
jgi:methyl-accepting chemotaxis protein